MASVQLARTEMPVLRLGPTAHSDYQFQGRHPDWSYPNRDTYPIPIMVSQGVGLGIQEPFQDMANWLWTDAITRDRSLIQGTGQTVASIQIRDPYTTSGLEELIKLERQRREREAGVWLDPIAQKLLSALDKETSIRWEDIPDKAECAWTEAVRAASLLVGSNICEVSPTRIRLSEYGDKLLAELSSAEWANHEVAS